MATIANLMKLTESLQTEVKAMRAEIAGLRAEPVKAPAKAAKAKKEVDPDAPPKETSWWIKATSHVRGILKAQIEADNAASLASGGKKLAGTVPVMVASMLKTSGQLADGLMPEDAEILEAYETFKVNPPAPKAKKEASGASVASAASGGSSATKTKFADLSEEEQKAARKARAIKAAATRAANKAAAAASASEASEAEAPKPKKAATPKKPVAKAAAAAAIADDDMDMPFILQGKAYLRIENALWDAATDAWVGMYDPKTKAIDPFAEEPERMEA